MGGGWGGLGWVGDPEGEMLPPQWWQKEGDSTSLPVRIDIADVIPRVNHCIGIQRSSTKCLCSA